MQKITVTLDDEVQQYLADHPTHFCAAHVVITTHDGNIYERWMPVPLGDMETPFGWNMLEQKFNRFLAGTPFDGNKQERFEFIRNLEHMNHVDKLLRF